MAMVRLARRQAPVRTRATTPMPYRPSTAAFQMFGRRHKCEHDNDIARGLSNPQPHALLSEPRALVLANPTPCHSWQSNGPLHRVRPLKRRSYIPALCPLHPPSAHRPHSHSLDRLSVPYVRRSTHDIPVGQTVACSSGLQTRVERGRG